MSSKYKIQTFDKIASEGLKRFPMDSYEVASEFKTPDAILLRSYALHDHAFATSVKAIARAGAGVNNIPVNRICRRENAALISNGDV